MYPRLFNYDLGGSASEAFNLSSYHGMVTVGFILAIFLLWHMGGVYKMKRDSLLDLGLYMVIFGILGARILHVIADGQLHNYINWCFDPGAVAWELTEEECRARDLNGIWDPINEVCRPENPQDRPVWDRCTLWLQFWQGGLAFYGGFLLASAYGIYFIRKEKLPLAQTLDMTGWLIPFGLSWGRIGCFLNGCCFGNHLSDGSHDAPLWSLTFPRWTPAWRAQLNDDLISSTASAALPVYPTQLMEAFGALAIAGFAYFYLEPRKRFAGQVFLSMCIMYASLRFLIEFFRADERGEVAGLSTSQIIAIFVVLLCSLAWYMVRKSKTHRSSQ